MFITPIIYLQSLFWIVYPLSFHQPSLYRRLTSIRISNLVSHYHHYRHLGLDNSLLWGAVLYIAEWLAISLGLTHQIPVATLSCNTNIDFTHFQIYSEDQNHPS